MSSQRPTPRFNPRGGERRPPRPLGAGARPSSPLWYGLALLVVLGIAQMYFLTPAGRSIPYSEFKSFLKSGQVAEGSIGDQQIRGTLKQDAGSDGKQSRQFTTTRVEDPKLTEELEAKGVKYTGEMANRWLPDLLGWIIPLVFFIGIWGFFFRRMSGAEGGVMSFARSRAKIYADDEVKVRFADVAGVDEAEDELKEIVEFLKNPKKYTNLGGRIPKGVLLVGPPGTGKTLLARAVAGEAHVPFFSLSGSEFVEMFVGVGAARIRDLFQQAEAKAPCIVFIDELDALGKVRVQSPMGSHEEREQTLNQLLAEMDGFDARKAIIIMAATNRPEVLDPALLRPGRFDRQVLVDKPDIKGREEVLRIHARNVKLAPGVNLKIIAARTAGFAGADLANLVNEAALLAARKDKNAVDMHDFDEAIEVMHVDGVLVLPRRQQRRFVHQVGQVRTRKAGRPRRDNLEVHAGRQLHVPRVDTQHLLTSLDVRLVDEHLAVEAARTQERRVEHLGPVGRGHDDDRLARVEAVHFRQQLVERLFALLVAAHRALNAHLAERVQLVDEDDARRLGLGLSEEIA